MSLAALQSAMVATVIARSARPHVHTVDLPATADLDHEERDWLHGVQQSPGFLLTCAVQRWWREYRLRSAARLTVAVLERSGRIALLEEWLARSATVSFFYQAEIEGFVDFVLERLQPLAPGARALLELERAAHVALAARHLAGAARRLQAKDSVVRHPAAALVVFPDEPGAVIAEWVEGKAPFRAEPMPVGVFVAPGLEGLGRPADGREIELWKSCSRPRRVANLDAGPLARARIRRLVRSSVLRVQCP